MPVAAPMRDDTSSLRCRPLTPLADARQQTTKQQASPKIQSRADHRRETERLPPARHRHCIKCQLPLACAAQVVLRSATSPSGITASAWRVRRVVAFCVDNGIVAWFEARNVTVVSLNGSSSVAAIFAQVITSAAAGPRSSVSFPSG